MLRPLSNSGSSTVSRTRDAGGNSKFTVMTVSTTLSDRRIWQDFANLLKSIDTTKLVQKHLEACDYKIQGYWDVRDRFYKEVEFSTAVFAELESSSLPLTHCLILFFKILFE